jgi:microcin C transport system permease protein
VVEAAFVYHRAFMRDYFIRRFLLMVPTFIGATMMVYFIIRASPGGPLEAKLRETQALSSTRTSRDAGNTLTEEQKLQLKARYKLDKPFLTGYGMWLGVLRDETEKQILPFPPEAKTLPVTLKRLLQREQWTATNAYQTLPATLDRSGMLKNDKGERITDWQAEVSDKSAAVFYPQFNGVLQGNLHESLRYEDSVWSMILERIPISLFYGIIGLLLSYGVCIPLGVIKAIKHRTVLDTTTSLLIFSGYAVPAFALASVLTVYPAARWGWFPSGGFVSESFSDLSLLAKLKDLFHHAVLPLLCYMIGGFATMTMLMKNNLMDNLAADYVRTAIAKGASFKQSVLRHALRNSLIPIASSLGGILGVFVTGSVLIERVFDINGSGLLHFQAVEDRDIPLMMGLLTVDVILLMLGNILSDFFVAITDPRVRFE